MDERTLYITEFDKKRLMKLIQLGGEAAMRANAYLESLAEELARGEIVDPATVPPDVITMNSRVLLVDLETGEEMIFTLVFPDEANLEEGKISVLAPIGTAMLGHRAGHIFSWRAPDGEQRMQIKEVLYQPEAAGDFHL